MRASIPADLQRCDPFLTIAAQAMLTDGEVEQTTVVERLLELRAMPSDHLTRSDRALRLFAMGCLFLVVEGGGFHVEEDLGTQRHVSADQLNAPSSPAGSRRPATRPTGGRVRRLPRRNIRAELRDLFGVIQLPEQVDYMRIPFASQSFVPPRRRGWPLWTAMVEDGRNWQADPLFVSEVADLLSVA